MCYNGLYRIKIKSEGGGWRDSKSTCGEISGSGKHLRISYNLDGDGCLLTVNDGVVTQERRGATCVKLVFEEGKRTSCTIGDGGLYGSYEIFTKTVKLISGERGVKLFLEYESGSDRETIKLTLTAVK